MANQKTIDSVKKLLSGHCYAPLKEAAEEWLKKVGEEGEEFATEKMIPLLKDGIATVEEMHELFGSAEGRAKFGEELAGQIHAHADMLKTKEVLENTISIAEELKKKGEEFCDCEACKTARSILEDLKK